MITRIFIFFSLIYFLGKGLDAANVYIAPFPGTNPDLDFYNEHTGRDEGAKFLYKLRVALEKNGYQVVFIKGGEKLSKGAPVISFNNVSPGVLSSLLKIRKNKKKFLFLFEPPVVMPEVYKKDVARRFDKVFVMFDDYVDNKQYFKFCYPQPRLNSIERSVSFDEKKNCALIAGNKKSSHKSELYSERVKTIKFFEKLKTFQLDLYGSGWNGYNCWKGQVASKWDTLCEYKFCVCYENMQDQNGYITEKIFDCFVAKCVPIYWGATNIEDYIPSDCFIDRRLFASNQELYDYLKNMNAEDYENYLLSAQNFLKSPGSTKFSSDSFVELVIRHLSL